jgi:hypothetical protein
MFLNLQVEPLPFFFPPPPGPTCLPPLSLPRARARVSATPSVPPAPLPPPVGARAVAHPGGAPRQSQGRRRFVFPARPPLSLPLPASNRARSPSSAQNPSRRSLRSEPLAAAIHRRRSTSARFPAREAPPPSPRPIQAPPGLSPFAARAS